MNIIILKDKTIHILDMDKGKRFDLKLPLYSIKMLPTLRKRPIVSGYVGPRGSGKSVGAARSVCIDYLLRGYNVWSNMWIGFQLVTPKGLITLETKPFAKLDMNNLDEVYHRGCIVWDEVNMDIAEARRSQSNSNLKASYLIQQIRKRELDVVWMAQSEMHVDSRLRAQTDIFIQCKDLSTVPSYHCELGQKSQWHVYDYSGLVKGNLPESGDSALFETRTIYNEPWWNCYDTKQLQGMDEEEEIEELSPEIKEKIQKVKILVEESEDQKIFYKDLWKSINVTPEEKRIISLVLPNEGIIRSRSNRYYELDNNYGIN